MTRHVLVGSGIAALAAAESIRAAQPGASITLVSGEAHPFYSRPGLAYLLAGAIPERQLQVRSPAELAVLRLERLTDRAVQLRPGDREVLLGTGKRLSYDRLLLATGAGSIPADFAGADLTGVVTLDGLDDTRRLVAASKRCRRAVVIGGGSTALEIVEGLHARGVETHYLLRGDRYWARVLDPVESALVERRLESSGVMLHRRTGIARALGSEGRVAAVETRAGAILPCDLVCVATGVRPRVELARSGGLSVDRGIVVSEYLETSAPDVFAAGDVAQAYDPAAGRPVLDTLWSSAAAQGRVAGLNMSGQKTPYRKQVALNVTCLAGLVATVVGDVGGEDDPDLVTITRGQSEAWHLGVTAMSVVDQQGDGRIRLRLGERTIIGALILGNQTLSEPVQRLVADQTDITPIRATLLEHPEVLPSTLLRFYQDRGDQAA